MTTTLTIGKQEVTINATANSSSAKTKEDVLNMIYTSKSALQYAKQREEKARNVEAWRYWVEEQNTCNKLIKELMKLLKRF